MWIGIVMPASSFPVRPPLQAMPFPTLRRYLALWLPFLAADRARLSTGAQPVERPFVLVDKDRGALRITALNAFAARNGLKIGMMLAEARALFPAIETADAAPEADAALLRRLGDLCDFFTPLVALQDKDGLLLDITGCAHLFGGEQAMLQRVRRWLADMRLTSCAGIAGTPEAAWAFARYRRNMIVPSDGQQHLAYDLPITALDQDTGTTLALSRAGFRTLGDLAKRPSHLLAARFGTGLVDRLHRIFGREDVRITPLRPPPDIVTAQHFSEPLAQIESLLAALERLAGNIAQNLEKRGAGGRSFEASFFRADGTVRRISIETAQGTRDPAVLMRLLKLRIEALADPLDPGFGFDAVRLAVLRSEDLAPSQAMLDGANHRAEQDGDIAALVDRLVARFGRQNVRRFVARETHDPVGAGGTVPYLSRHQGAAWLVPEPGQPPARPLTLFDPPQLIEVLAEVPDSPPLRFRWRRVLHEVRLAEGPERIAPEWWRAGSSAPATRDYYRVEDAQGHRFWIFREGFYEDTTDRPRWFLHGLFA